MVVVVKELCEARPKLPAPPTEEYMPWPAGAVKSFPHRLLYYRVNRLNHMLKVRASHTPLLAQLTRGVRGGLPPLRSARSCMGERGRTT